MRLLYNNTCNDECTQGFELLTCIHYISKALGLANFMLFWFSIYRKKPKVIAPHIFNSVPTVHTHCTYTRIAQK